MSTMAAVGNGLQAALLLARGRREGMDVLMPREEPALRVAARSFWAAALSLPAFVCLQLTDLAQAKTVPADMAHGFALDLLGFVISWTAFALLSRHAVAALGRAALWPRYIAAWNWVQVVQFLLLVAASLPPLLGLPDLVGDTARLVAIGWALWLEWYATRLALECRAGQAMALVALDVAVGTLIPALMQSISGAG